MPDPILQSQFKKILELQKSLRLPSVMALFFFMYIGLSSSPYFFGIHKSSLLALCLIIIPGFVFFHFFKWRCPSCSKYLGRINPQIQHCPHCQVELQTIEPQDS